jgi:hypothetical protein
MVKLGKRGSAFFEVSEPIQPYGTQPFKNVSVLAMQWLMTVRLNKPLDFLEPGNDPLLARRAPPFLFGRGQFLEFVE